MQASSASRQQGTRSLNGQYDCGLMMLICASQCDEGQVSECNENKRNVCEGESRRQRECDLRSQRYALIVLLAILFNSIRSSCVRRVLISLSLNYYDR